MENADRECVLKLCSVTTRKQPQKIQKDASFIIVAIFYLKSKHRPLITMIVITVVIWVMIMTIIVYGRMLRWKTARIVLEGC